MKIGRTDDGLYAHRTKRGDVVLSGGEDGRLVFLFPAADEPRFSLAAEHHEGRRAIGMNRVGALLGAERNLLLVSAHHRAKFLTRAAADVEKQRNDADAFRQQANEFLRRAGTQRRMNDARNAAPCRKSHAKFLLLSRALEGRAERAIMPQGLPLWKASPRPSRRSKRPSMQASPIPITARPTK